MFNGDGSGETFFSSSKVKLRYKNQEQQIKFDSISRSQ